MTGLVYFEALAYVIVPRCYLKAGQALRSVHLQESVW